MENIIKDSNFHNGFLLKGLSSLQDGHKSIHEYRFNGSDPSWYLCQWNSKYNLVEGRCERKEESFSIFDASKCLSGNNGELTFRLEAGKEYDAPRKPDEGWPHLLIEQELPLVPVSRLSKLTLSGIFTLTNFQDHMRGEAKDYHAAQFVWVVVFSNRNPASKDFGRFMWVVLGLFDSRYDYPPLYCAQDAALPNGEFIYSFCAKDYLSSPMSDGKPHAICFDLRSRLPSMLLTAQKNGFLTNTSPEDLCVASTNMGFEIPGTFDAEIRAKNIEILAEYAEDKEEI